MAVQAQSKRTMGPGVPKGELTGFELIYEFEKGAPHIGDYKFYRKTYLSDPVVQTNINIPCRYAFKNGWYVEGLDQDAKDIVVKYLEKVGFNQKGYIWLKDAKIFGMGYFEYTKEQLYIRNPDTMFVKLDMKGRIVGWEQRSAYQLEPIMFEAHEIIYFANNPFSDSIYGISDIESVRYVIRFLKDQAERDVGAMLNKYVGERYLVRGGTETDPFDTPELNDLRTYFTHLKFGEDVITADNVKVDSSRSTNHAFDFRAYLDYILMILAIGMNVPIIFWEGRNSTNATAEVQLKVFESYIKFIQTQVEDALNTQLIPNLMRDFANTGLKLEHFPQIKFHEVSLDDVFMQAKTDLIYLQSKVLGAEEVRARQGLDLRYGPEKAPNEKGTNIVGQTGKPDAEKEINKSTQAKLGQEMTEAIAGVHVVDMIKESE